MDSHKIVLLALLGALSWLAYLMVKPFLSYLIGAALIAFIIRPVHERTSDFLPEKLSAGLLVFIGVFLAVFPFLFAANAVMDDARDLGQDLENADRLNISEIENRIEDLTDREIDLRRSINQGLERFLDGAFGGFSQVLSFITDLAIGFTIMLFLMYYLILDGNKLVEWLKQAVPLESQVEEKLFEDIERTTWAVINGHVLVAIVQGLVAGIGLFAVGISNYVFWTFVMIILGFIPIIGTFVIWGPASLYLFAIGETVSGLALAIYGLVVVGLTDNILRPFAVDRKANIHPAVILIGVIGGVYLFGAVGLFIGPIILGIFRSVLFSLKNNYKDL